MKHGAVPELEDLLQPLETLMPLPGNPRRGNVAAIKASYEKFGQVRPIIAVDNEDGTYTVIAGNHQLKAVSELGWTHMAVLIVPFDSSTAVEFALADNRVAELGETDQDLLFEMLETVVNSEPEFWDNLGWDDFEMASLEVSYEQSTTKAPTFAEGYTAPTLLEDEDDVEPLSFEGTDEETKDVVTQGATSAGRAGGRPQVQYTMIFEDADQQQEWYAFLRYLKSIKDLEGMTTSAQVLWFVGEHLGGREV